MKIAIVTDQSRTAYLKDKEGEYEDAQKSRTVKALKEVISKKYDCQELVFDNNIVKNLKKEKIDLVFNLCNGIVGSARLSQLPAILESIEMPYTASKPLGHALAYNKVYTSKILKGSGIPTPDFTYVNSLEELESIDMDFPLFIKPSDEGSSRGIYQDSVVYDKESMEKVVGKCLKRYNPPVLIMEYIEGREFTVGLIKNGERVLPILEVDFSALPEGLKHINSFEVKNEYQDHVIYHIPANIDRALKETIEKTVKDAFEALDLKDYSRIDIIVRKGVPYIIEVNSLPGLEKGYSDICKMAEKEFSYEELIFNIIDSAKMRYKI
nr:ATP-grasp domain-containing protein [Tissierella sp.]